MGHVPSGLQPPPRPPLAPVPGARCEVRSILRWRGPSPQGEGVINLISLLLHFQFREAHFCPVCMSYLFEVEKPRTAQKGRA